MGFLSPLSCHSGSFVFLGRLMTPMDWKIGKCRRYFGEISVIGRHRNDNRHRLSIDGKIGQKSAKSPIYRRNIGGEPKNRRNIGEWRHARRRRRWMEKNRRLIGKIGDISTIFWKYRRFFADKIAINRRFFQKNRRFFPTRFHPCNLIFYKKITK